MEEIVTGPQIGSPKELAVRRKQFDLIEEGKLCITPGFGGGLYFIAIKKIDNKRWQVVRLTTDNNIKLITEGIEKCKITFLHFNKAWGLTFSNDDAHKG